MRKQGSGFDRFHVCLEMKRIEIEITAASQTDYKTKISLIIRV